MEWSETVETVERLHSEARDRGLYFQTAEDERLTGRTVTLGGKEMISFGSCSYLGLEYHPALRACAHDMIDRYGTQFASSRGYLSAPPYIEFEEKLSEIFDAHAIQLQTTTLAHQAAFDALIDERDVLVLDHQVHMSVLRAARLAQVSGTRVEIVRHEQLYRALDVVAELAPHYRTVWFATDGITSMYGDLAPVGLLEDLLDVAPNVRLYVDDAHGMTWTGEKGRGSILSRMPLSKRLIVATSLAKAFAAGGGALIFEDPEECERVRLCGIPSVFSGPLQPPLLGAALASARLHLTDELAERQKHLLHLIRYANGAFAERALPLLVDEDVPVKFIRCGLPRVAEGVVRALMDDGIYANVSMFPAVSMRRAGVRLGITYDHTEAQIDQLADRIAFHLPLMLAHEGVTREELDALFEDSAVERIMAKSGRSAGQGLARMVAKLAPVAQAASGSVASEVELDPRTLEVEVTHTIGDIDKADWDRRHGAGACISWDAMRTAEAIFANHPKPEHAAEFRYVTVRNPADGSVVASAPVTLSLQKDDMFMRAEVSRAVEDMREDDPHFLTSRTVMVGTDLSEGEHIYLDRSGPWRAGLRRLVETVVAWHDDEETPLLVLRDLVDTDSDLEAALGSEGLVRADNPETHLLAVDWTDDEGLVAGLDSQRKRKFVRDLLKASGDFQVTVYEPGQADPALAPRFYELYRAVAQGLRINTFPLPEDAFEHLVRSPAWEIGTLKHPEAGGDEVLAFWAAHRYGDHYAWLIAGLDYQYVRSHGIYRQLMLQVVRRAQQVGARTVHMGMTAEREKLRFGCKALTSSAYFQSRNDYDAARLREVVASLASKK